MPNWEKERLNLIWEGNYPSKESDIRKSRIYFLYEVLELWRFFIVFKGDSGSGFVENVHDIFMPYHLKIITTCN